MSLSILPTLPTKIIILHGFTFNLFVKNAISIFGNFSSLMIKRFKKNMILEPNKKFLLHEYSNEFEPIRPLFTTDIDNNNNILILLILCVNINIESLELIKLSYPESTNIIYKHLTEQECLTNYPDIFSNTINTSYISNISNISHTSHTSYIPLFDDNISCIIEDKLYLTGCVGARNLEKLIENGITHIINITDILENYFENELNIQGEHRFTYLKISIPDSNNINIIEYFPLAFEFIDTALAISNVSNNNKVLVHCFAGKSRSASIIIGWLMKTRKMTYEDALQFVRNYRSCIEPNLGFCFQLREYQKQCF